MESLNQKLMIQNSNSLLMEQSLSGSQTLVKRNLFTKNAKPLILPLSTSKKIFGHQNLTTQNSQWIPTAKTALTATGIISTLSAGSYFAYQYFTKSVPLKVTVSPFSLIDPIKTVLTTLSVLGVAAVGTQLYISRSNDRRDETLTRSNLKIPKKEHDKKPISENLLSIEQETELLLKTLLISSSEKDNDMLKKDQSSRAIELAKKLIDKDPDAASSIISLIAKNLPKEIYSLIEPVLLKNDQLHNKFLENAMNDIMESLNTYMGRFFSDENSLQLILDVIEPYMLNKHSFADDFYSKFLTTWPLSGWSLANICIGNETPVAKEIVGVATENLFNKERTGATAKFAIKWIQQYLEKCDQDYSIYPSLQILYSNLCDKTKLEETIKDQIKLNLVGDTQIVANELMAIASIMHDRKDLLSLLGEEYMDSSKKNDFNPMLNQHERSTKTINNF